MKSLKSAQIGILTAAALAVAGCEHLPDKIAVLFLPSVEFVQPPESSEIVGYQAVFIRHDGASAQFAQQINQVYSNAKIGLNPLFGKVSLNAPTRDELNNSKWATLAVERYRVSRNQESNSEERTKCKDNKIFCKDENVQSRTRVSCTTRTVSVQAELAWSDTSGRRAISSRSYSDSARNKVCTDEQVQLPTYESLEAQAAQLLLKKSAASFLPSINKRPLELIDQEAGASAEMNAALKQAMEQAKAGKLQYVEEVFLAAQQSGENGFALLFNLGLLMQIKGDFLAAQQYYEQARLKLNPQYESRFAKYSAEVNSLVASGVKKAWVN